MISQFDDFSNPFANFSGFGIPEVKEEELTESEITAFGKGLPNPGIHGRISEVKDEKPTLPLETTVFTGEFSNLEMLGGIPKVEKEEPAPQPEPMDVQQPAANIMQEILVAESPKQNAMDLSIFEIDFMNEYIPSANDFSNRLLLDTTIAAYDSDLFQAELPAYPVYCTVEVNSNLVSKDPEWIEICMQACPSSAHEMLKHLTEWMQKKIHLFQTPKISVPNQKWGIAEILQQQTVLDELERSYRIIWQTAVQLAEGTETVEWVASVAISMLLRHLTSFFVLQVR